MHDDDRQQRLDFSLRRCRLNLLDNLALPAPPPECHSSAGAMAAALKAIEACIRDGDTWALKWATLAAKMQVSPRTARRACDALQRLGILAVMPNRKKTGWRANTFRIVWANLQDFDRRIPNGHDGQTEWSPRPDRVVTTASPSGHRDQSSLTTPLIDPSKAPSNNDHESRGKFFASEVEKGAANHHADKLARRLRVTTASHPNDISLIIKVAVLLAKGQVAEDDVTVSVEAVNRKQPGTPCAYFHTTLDARLGGTLNELLATVPDTISRPRANA